MAIKLPGFERIVDGVYACGQEGGQSVQVVILEQNQIMCEEDVVAYFRIQAAEALTYMRPKRNTLVSGLESLPRKSLGDIAQGYLDEILAKTTPPTSPGNRVHRLCGRFSCCSSGGRIK